jgi:hypothetical protein
MAYRNDEDAVEARRIELERELADVKERSNEFAYLSWKQKELETELSELKKRKASFARKRLPMLAQAKVASPCSASWENMSGNDQVRFCGSCQKNVYDLSSMTSVEAEALLREKEGDLCARFYRRADGTIMTSDCSVGVRKKRVQRVAAAALFFGGAAAAFSAWDKSHPAGTEAPMAMGMMTLELPPDPKAPHVDQPTTKPPTTNDRPQNTDQMHVMGVLRRAPVAPPKSADGTGKTKSASRGAR